jgi:hypothetical protein
MMEKRLIEGIPIDEETWNSITLAASKVGLRIDSFTEHQVSG